MPSLSSSSSFLWRVGHFHNERYNDRIYQAYDESNNNEEHYGKYIASLLLAPKIGSFSDKFIFSLSHFHLALNIAITILKVKKASKQTKRPYAPVANLVTAMIGECPRENAQCFNKAKPRSVELSICDEEFQSNAGKASS
ncbi:Hypothetical predicted protein [Octopus vulgaris]|uniref:Uncharacterized protein n=1 Tax=Octopus vulgaris TaxID=6645 RepID=A0AA36BF32_OCTVU|nr:Hypothetical predicted protein [Octopus vulgaris]